MSRLEIFGFKSFLNRTVFQFGEGVTSIVGPNGCGKSNIVDAIVWALGERGTKSLRVKDMGDVIFHGSNGKRPVNMAEVSLELTDGDKDLVVKRRIYRDGTNEYFLNGNIVRLRDVQDVFLGTGVGLNSYAIIEQGKIESFIQMKPLERRTVIEETSGITRFEEKKREAMTRLEETSINLARIDDIYKEVTASFEKTEYEWQRWKAYQVLADKLHEIDKQILLDGYSKIRKRISKIQEKQGELEAETAKKEEERAALKQELDAKESEFTLTDNIVRQLEVDIKGKEKDMENRLLEIEYIQEESNRLEAQCNTCRENETNIRTLIGEQEKEIEVLSENYLIQKDELEKEETTELTLREETEKAKTTIEESEKRLEEERTGLFVAMSRLTDTKNRISEIERARIEKQKREEREASEKRILRETASKLEATQKDLKNVFDKEKEEGEALSVEEGRCLHERETVRRNIDEERNSVERLKNEKKIKEDFLKQLGGLIEGIDSNQPSGNKLINMIKVEEAREKALERFFSDELEYTVITETEPHAISETVRKQEGNYIFFPGKGIFTLGDHEVEINVRWIGDIDEALARIEKGEEGVFINDTVYIDSRGVILSGKGKKRIDLKQFKEKLKLEKELKTTDETLREHHDNIQEIQKEFVRCDTQYQAVKKTREEKDSKINRLEKEVLLTEAQIRSTMEKLNILETKVDLTEEISSTETDRLLEEKQKSEAEKSERESKMEALKAGLNKIKENHQGLVSQWHGITIDIERRRNTLKTVEEDKERRLANIRKLSEEIRSGQTKTEQIIRNMEECKRKIESLEKNYDDLKKEQEKHQTRFEELKTMLGNLHMEKHTLQDAIDEKIKEIDKTRLKRENTDKDIAIFTEKQMTVLEKLKTTYNIENPDEIAIQIMSHIEDEREAVASEIAAMGEINFRAEKEYLELQERIAFLEKQKEDLDNSVESLKKTIAKIDLLTRELFAETFDKVNEAFKRFTDLLFKGGKGYLAVNQENGGVDMFAQPPGKKVVRMELLSGGEKALISLALLLALMDTKPSPFSLMDEIDAPLDDANLTALLEIVKTMGLKTQIIFITHNRITMEGSDTIYGVTMEEQGISKTVSVKL